MEFTFYDSKKYKLTLCLSVAIFFYVFLVFFLPFGVDNYNPRHQYTADFLLEIFYFFIVVLSASLVNEFLLRPLLLKKATIRPIILWTLWSFILLGTLIFFTYNYLGNWHDFRFKSYLGFLVNCSSVLIFPTVGSFFYFRYRSLQQQMNYMLTSKGDSNNDELIQFRGQGSRDQITLASSIFLYGRAQDNYVELYYWEQEHVRKFLMRASLGKLAESIAHQEIIRCHRSYLVNLLQVEAIKGGINDLHLYLRGEEVAIPVSKSYREDVLSQLKILMDFAQ